MLHYSSLTPIFNDLTLINICNCVNELLKDKEYFYFIILHIIRRNYKKKLGKFKIMHTLYAPPQTTPTDLLR